MPGEARFKDVAKGICGSKSYSDPSYIGAGAFKEAYLTQNPSNLPVALKIFDPQKCNLYRAEREIEAMRRCDSPFIGKVYDWGEFSIDDSISFLFLVEEYIPGGTLTNRLQSTSHSVIQICDYGITLLKAVSHLKDNFLVHRDIKPDNIMFRSGDDVPVLVDFGLVRDLSGLSITPTLLQQGPGTPFFASPEQLTNEKALIDWRSDQFSIGVVLCLCLTGSHPYQQPGQNKMQAVEQVIARATCSGSISEIIIELGCGFIMKMVSPWPVERFAHPDLIIREFENLKEGLIS
jgi:serine/threonine protein kinase